jgi:hypothetical protein
MAAGLANDAFWSLAAMQTASQVYEENSRREVVEYRPRRH